MGTRYPRADIVFTVLAIALAIPFGWQGSVAGLAALFVFKFCNFIGWNESAKLITLLVGMYLVSKLGWNGFAVVTGGFACYIWWLNEDRAIDVMKRESELKKRIWELEQRVRPLAGREPWVDANIKRLRERVSALEGYSKEEIDESFEIHKELAKAAGLYEQMYESDEAKAHDREVREQIEREISELSDEELEEPFEKTLGIEDEVERLRGEASRPNRKPSLEP